MISFEEFFEIFKEIDSSREALFKFYKSIKKLVALCYADKKGLSLMLKLDEKYQWPILTKMDNPQLEIYKKIYKKAKNKKRLVEKFIALIKAQKEVYFHYQKEKVLTERIELYPAIFDFSCQDLQYCQKIGERYTEMWIRKRKRLLLKGGIAAGVVGVTGVGAYLIGKKIKEKAKGKIVEGKIKKRL